MNDEKHRAELPIPFDDFKSLFRRSNRQTFTITWRARVTIHYANTRFARRVHDVVIQRCAFQGRFSFAWPCTEITSARNVSKLAAGDSPS